MQIDGLLMLAESSSQWMSTTLVASGAYDLALDCDSSRDLGVVGTLAIDSLTSHELHNAEIARLHASALRGQHAPDDIAILRAALEVQTYALTERYYIRRITEDLYESRRDRFNLHLKDHVNVLEVVVEHHSTLGEAIVPDDVFGTAIHDLISFNTLEIWPYAYGPNHPYSLRVSPASANA
jgi:hypothetical protein